MAGAKDEAETAITFAEDFKAASHSEHHQDTTLPDQQGSQDCDPDH
jgi:hypothetical protein